MTCGTYTITNKITGEWYAGQGVSIEARWRAHRNGTGKAPLLASAIKRYGRDNFLFEIVEVCVPDKEVLRVAEQKLLDRHPPYNICWIASSVLGVPKSDAMKEKLRGNKNSLGKIPWNKGLTKASNPIMAMLAAKMQETRRSKFWSRGKGIPVSEEQKQKISATLTGRKLSEEHKQNISKGGMGRPPTNKGVPMSEDVKLKISETVKKVRKNRFWSTQRQKAKA